MNDEPTNIIEYIEKQVAECQSECDRHIRGARLWRRLQFLALLLTSNTACLIWEADWFLGHRWHLMLDVPIWSFITILWCVLTGDRIVFHRDWKVRIAELRDEMKKRLAQWQGYGKETE